MNDFDDDRINFRAPVRHGAGVWSLAALSIAACLCSVLGAKILARMVVQGDAPALLFSSADRSMRNLAKTAPGGQAPQTVTIVRSVGVDGMTTATIPHSSTVQISPCGESKQR